MAKMSSDVRSKCCHLLLHVFGISMGLAAMLAIALFEDNIQLVVGNGT